MSSKMERSRRDFLRDAALATGALAASGIPALAAETKPDLIVASGDDPKAMIRKAIAELGGMKAFVSRGDVVVIKPNMAWVRRPDQAANTNPDLMAALVEMAFEAGAKTVKVWDRGAAETKDYREAYATSGIADAVRKVGAETPLTYDMKSATVTIKDGVFLKEVAVYRDALECDCFINVPVAKHHGMTQVTLAMKNLMGIVDGARRDWHKNIDQALTDFASAFRPKLNVLDAYRILVRRGPLGGNVQDVEQTRKCIVGVNQASVDAFGATLFGKQAANIGHIAMAGKRGLGEVDTSKLSMREITV